MVLLTGMRPKPGFGPTVVRLFPHLGILTNGATNGGLKGDDTDLGPSFGGTESDKRG